MELAPKLKSPIRTDSREAVWKEVLIAANRHGISRFSLVVIAALSVVAVPNGKSPALKVPKLKANYALSDAYNALADLRALEILAHLLAIVPNRAVALWTADKNLARFWTGIRVSDFVWTDRFRCKISPVTDLFSGVSLTLLSDFLNSSSVPGEVPLNIT